jgi:hypothetical protein
MNVKRTAAIVVVGGAFAAWLYAGATSGNRDRVESFVTKPPAIDSRGAELDAGMPGCTSGCDRARRRASPAAICSRSSRRRRRRVRHRSSCRKPRQSTCRSFAPRRRL